MVVVYLISFWIDSKPYLFRANKNWCLKFGVVNSHFWFFFIILGGKKPWSFDLGYQAWEKEKATTTMVTPLNFP